MPNRYQEIQRRLKQRARSLRLAEKKLKKLAKRELKREAPQQEAPNGP